jgi:hypothetical protein
MHVTWVVGESYFTARFARDAENTEEISFFIAAETAAMKKH